MERVDVHLNTRYVCCDRRTSLLLGATRLLSSRPRRQAHLPHNKVLDRRTRADCEPQPLPDPVGYRYGSKDIVIVRGVVSLAIVTAVQRLAYIHTFHTSYVATCVRRDGRYAATSLSCVRRFVDGDGGVVLA